MTHPTAPCIKIVKGEETRLTGPNDRNGMKLVALITCGCVRVFGRTRGESDEAAVGERRQNGGNGIPGRREDQIHAERVRESIVDGGVVQILLLERQHHRRRSVLSMRRFRRKQSGNHVMEQLGYISEGLMQLYCYKA